MNDKDSTAQDGEPVQCCGLSAHGDCPGKPLYAVQRNAGRDASGTPKVKTFYACGRHLSWTVNHVTSQLGPTVTVMRLYPHNGGPT